MQHEYCVEWCGRAPDGLHATVVSPVCPDYSGEEQSTARRRRRPLEAAEATSRACPHRRVTDLTARLAGAGGERPQASPPASGRSGWHVAAQQPVAMAFEALGDRWSALVLREIFLGARRFEELVIATGASRATLTLRLRSLVDQGILHRHPYQARPTRFEYRLTRMGADLYPTALMYWLWEKHFGQKSGLPQELVHKTCGHAMLPLLVCRSCRDPIGIGNIRVEIVAEPDERQVSCRSTACTLVRTPGAGSKTGPCTSST